MFDFRSALFRGDTLLQAIADDTPEPDGGLTRISPRQHRSGEPTRKMQTALLTWRPDVLPRFGADGDFGSESATAVHAFKRDELGVPEDEIIDDVGPRTVQALDGIQAAAEAPPTPTPPPAPTVFVRRSAWALETPDAFDPVTLAYARAVAAMQARPASDRTSWTFQAAIHGTFAPVPAGVRWNECQHQQWFFLPWHRMYLHFFERIVRAAVVAAGGPADFALPYWDYEGPGDGAMLPPAFRATQLPDGSPNPLLVAAPGRSAVMNAGGTIPPDARNSAPALAVTNFSGPPEPGFGGRMSAPAHFLNFESIGALEGTPHNVVHPLVGGRVGSTTPNCNSALMTKPSCAALDPIFWLHHANIDRLWNRWLALGGGRGHPADPAWRNQAFTLYDETGAEVTITVADVLDSEAQLGYRYDDVAPFTPAMVPVAPPAVPPRLIAATDQTLELTGSGDMVSLPLDTGAIDAFETVFARDNRAWVSVEDIDVDSDPGLAYAVYLDTPSGRHHIGNVSLFGIDRMRDQDVVHDAATGFRHTFDVSDLLARLAGELADMQALGMWFEPLRPEPPPGFAPEEEEPAGTVRIGRVSLWVAPVGPDVS